MGTSGVTEIISYFAGYLHLIQESARDRLDYAEFMARRSSDDFDPEGSTHEATKHDLDDLDSTAMPVPFVPEAQPLIDFDFEGPKDIFSDWSGHANLGATSPARDIYNFQLVGGGSVGGSVSPGMSQLKISVTYGEGGDDLALEVQQSNTLSDDDVALSGGWTLTGLEHDEGYAELLEDMNAQSDAEIPDDIVLTGHDTQSLLTFLSDHDSAWTEEAEPHGTVVTPGVYVNGVLQPEGAELPKEPEAPVEEISTEHPAQIAELGGNAALNAAVIVDVNHSVGTLVVVGDYFSTDAIIQTIAYMDADQVGYAGAAQAVIESHGNQANNVASFVNTDLGVPGLFGTTVFAGLNWNVDVVDGDFYNVHSVEQVNWLRDNDLTVQSNYESNYQLVAGTNELGSFSNLVSIGSAYDLVIVLGSFHEANLIYQKLVLLDQDSVTVLNSGENGDQAPAISTGSNWLMNEASIEHVGSQTFLPLTSTWESLIAELTDQAGELDASLGIGIPNFGDDPLDVLFITGDVWDINVLTQTAVVVDVDAAFQLLPSDYVGTEEGVEQSASTGGNSLTNLAGIVDTGPIAGTFIGGDMYDDDILIQAEIVVSDEDEVVYGDTETLVPELIAFTGTPTTGEEQPETVAAPDPNLNNDLLGNVLT